MKLKQEVEFEMYPLELGCNWNQKQSIEKFRLSDHNLNFKWNDIMCQNFPGAKMMQSLHYEH